MCLNITGGQSGVCDSTYSHNALSDVSQDWFKLDVIAAPTKSPPVCMEMLEYGNRTGLSFGAFMIMNSPEIGGGSSTQALDIAMSSAPLEPSRHSTAMDRRFRQRRQAARVRVRLLGDCALLAAHHASHAPRLGPDVLPRCASMSTS